MYNKLFTKILDSSIWLEPDATRIVWLTLLAAMDEDGFAQFASVANLAHRAIVPLDACQKAVDTLQSDDPNSSDTDNGGKRIERVPGGWVVLNAGKYREVVTRAAQRERWRERTSRHRAKKRQSVVTDGHAMSPSVTLVTPKSRNAHSSVTESEAYAEAGSKEQIPANTARFARFWSAYPKKVGKDEALKAWNKRKPSEPQTQEILAAVERQRDYLCREGGKFIPNPSTWLNQGRWQDEPPQDPAAMMEQQALSEVQAEIGRWRKAGN